MKINIDKKYLPSPQFIARITILAILIGIILAIYGIVYFFKNTTIFGKDSVLSGPKKVEVRDIIGKDSNSNGIADWEESFWGLDPYTDGDKNKETILSKRSQIAKDGGIDLSKETNLTENEIFSRQFFAVIMSLQQTGDLNEETVKNLADEIGQKIVATPIADTYAKSDLKTRTTNTDNIKLYFDNFKALADKYINDDIGNELTFVVLGLKNGDEQSLSIASQIAESYRAFARDLMEITVPTSLASTQLSIANNYMKEAESIDGLTKLIDDPIISMRSLINYKAYNEAIVSDLDELKVFFQRNGIIKSNE